MRGRLRHGRMNRRTFLSLGTATVCMPHILVSQPSNRPAASDATATPTIEELRKRFWWLGPDGSYIVALDENTVTIKVIQTSWARTTLLYEEAVARDFAQLGLSVTWQPFFCEKLSARIDEERQRLAKTHRPFDEHAFVERMRRIDASEPHSLRGKGARP